MLCPWAISFFQKLCPAPFPPVSCSFPEPYLGPQCCLYNLLEGQPENSWPFGGKYCIISNPSRYSGLPLPCFLQCATTASLSESTRADDRHSMPARTPYIGGIPSRAIQLPGIMFATLGVSPVGHLGQNPCHPFLKLQTYPQTKSPLHFYGTSGLLPLITLFLSHLLTPTTRTLPPCSNITSPSLLSKYFFKKILLYFALQYCIGFTIH